MKRTFYAGLLVAGLAAFGAPAAAAGTARRLPRRPSRPSHSCVWRSPPVDERSAQDTRQRLNEILRDYPPSLTQVLRLDPTLLNNADYLAPYPALAAYIAQHPEVSRHAAFYLGRPDFERQQPGRRTLARHTRYSGT